MAGWCPTRTCQRATGSVGKVQQPMTLPPRNPRPGREFPRPGPSPEVSETSEQCAVPQGAVPQCAVPQCAVPPCAAHAAGTLRLVVEGYDAVLPMCGTHG